MFGEKKSDKAELYRMFTIIYRYNVAGIGIVEALRAYNNNIEKEYVKEITEELISTIESGVSFPDAMAKFPDFFPGYVIGLIRVGENSGEMSKILDEINMFLKQDIDMDRKIRSAMWVQKVFIVGIIFVLAMAVIFVIPQMGEVLENADIELPLLTKAVLGFGRFCISFWYLIALIVGGIFFYLQHLKRNQPEKYEWLKLRLPIFKDVYFYQLQYRFTKVFGICKDASVETIDAIDYSTMAVDNALFRMIMNNSVEEHKRTGMDIVSCIKKTDTYRVFDPSLFTMLAAGMGTANIGQIMLAESEGYKKDLEAVLQVMGDKIGLSITIPGYICLIILFAALEFPLFRLMDSVGKIGISG